MTPEEERQIRWKKRIEEMRKAKRRRELLYKWGGLGAGAAVLLIAAAAAGSLFFHKTTDTTEPEAARGRIERAAVREEIPKIPESTKHFMSKEEAALAAQLPEGSDVPLAGPSAVSGGLWEVNDDSGSFGFNESIVSEYGILVDVDGGMVLAQRAARTRMNPASMTKILTVLVAAERLTEEDLEQTVPITIEITDYCFINECSVTGFERDEVVPVRDLFYGTVLPSGADASLALANYVAGSHEAFVDLMNEKLAELGLAETSHFTNCVGLYDENHYSTAYDMAVMLKAAADNEFCRQLLSARTYTTTQTKEHPEGLVISNWFLRRIEDKDVHGEVVCGKTGYVDQSGSCAASLAVGSDGKEYICVTAASNSKWRCIDDQVELYQRFLPEMAPEPGTPETPPGSEGP